METIPRLSNGTICNDHEWPLMQISRSRYYLTSNNSKIVYYYLQWQANNKSYMIYRMAPYSATLNNPYTRFQGHTTIWCWISQKQYGIQTQFQWNTNRDLHTSYSTVRAKYSVSQSVTQSLCNSWASCAECSQNMCSFRDKLMLQSVGRLKDIHTGVIM